MGDGEDSAEDNYMASGKLFNDCDTAAGFFSRSIPSVVFVPGAQNRLTNSLTTLLSLNTLPEFAPESPHGFSRLLLQPRHVFSRLALLPRHWPSRLAP